MLVNCNFKIVFHLNMQKKYLEKNVEALIEHQKNSHNVEYSPEFFELDHTMNYDPLDISVHEEKMPKEQPSKLELQETNQKSNGFEKKFQCPICLKMFKTEWYVRKHIERVHGGKNPPSENKKTEFASKPENDTVDLKSDTLFKSSSSDNEYGNLKNLGDESNQKNISPNIVMNRVVKPKGQ